MYKIEMKVFDCIPFFDEKMILDLRLNILDQYVDYFVIVEQSYTHSGRKKKKIFNINDYLKFKKKIRYYYLEDEPKNLISINKIDKKHAGHQRINSLKRIGLQYNKLMDGLGDAQPDDIIIVGDCDEIPDLSQVNFETIKNDIILFKQKIYYYKFNLLHEGLDWFGNKACKKKDFISPEWLKYVKNKQYPFWRVDTFFSKTKYTNVKIIEKGGWHFTNIKSDKEIYYKLMNYGEHNEFERSGLNENDIKNLIENKKLYFNHQADKTSNKKYSSSIDLKFENDVNLPEYLTNNKNEYLKWFAKND